MLLPYMKEVCACREGFSCCFIRVTFAGFFGLCATIVSYPLDVCRTRMSVDMTTIKDIKGEQGGGTGRTYTSITQCVKEITKREGWRALYRGVSLSLLSSVPYATISFTAYDNLRGRYERDHRLSEGDTTTEESFLSRVLGRRRMQSDRFCRISLLLNYFPCSKCLCSLYNNMT